MNLEISLAARKRIKDNLKFGDISRIAKLSGKSRSTIKRWFLGEGDSFEIPEAINSLYRSRQKTIDGFKSSVKSISV